MSSFYELRVSVGATGDCICREEGRLDRESYKGCLPISLMYVDR